MVEKFEKNSLVLGGLRYTVKKVPSRDVTYQTLPERELRERGGESKIIGVNRMAERVVKA